MAELPKNFFGPSPIPREGEVPVSKEEPKKRNISGHTVEKQPSLPPLSPKSIESEKIHGITQEYLRPEKASRTGFKAVPEVEMVVKEAAKNRQELAELRQKAIEDLQSGKPATEIAKNLSGGMKKFMARLYQEGVEKLGPPPCDFCVATLGSVARDESGPYPDYDNFLIIKERTSKSIEYFTKLNQYVADRVYRLGEEEGEGYFGGLRFCGGDLNSPYQIYKYRYASKTEGLERELEEARPEAMPEVAKKLEASLRRPTYGGRSSLLEVPESLQAFLGDIVDSAPIFGNAELYDAYMSTALSNKKDVESTALGNIQRNVRGLSEKKDSPISSETIPEMLHVKNDLMRLPQAVVTSLAMYYGLKEKGTIARIDALRKMGVFTAEFSERLKATVKQLIRLRVQAQSAYKEEFEFISLKDWESLNQYRESVLPKLEAIRRKESELGMSVEEKKDEIEQTIIDLERLITQLEENPSDPKVLKTLRSRGWPEDIKKLRELCKKQMEGIGPIFELMEHKKLYEAICGPKIPKKQYPAQMSLEMERLITQLEENPADPKVLKTLRSRGWPTEIKKLREWYKKQITQPPALSPFTPEDGALLESEVLPTLRDLYAMAKEGVEGGRFNPQAFSRK